MKVLVGCPVRNRAWCFAEHLLAVERDCMIAMGRGVSTEAFYLVNDSIDATEATLLLKDYIDYQVFNTGYGGYERAGLTENRRTEKNMAIVFNEWMKRSLDYDYDYLYLVSSDVMPREGTLATLLEDVAIGDDTHLFGAVCLNSISGTQNWMLKAEIGYFRPGKVDNKCTFEVGMVGSPVLIPRSAVASSARHTDHPQSHICGWYDDLRALGYRFFANPNVHVDHWLDLEHKLSWRHGYKYCGLRELR